MGKEGIRPVRLPGDLPELQEDGHLQRCSPTSAGRRSSTTCACTRSSASGTARNSSRSFSRGRIRTGCTSPRATRMQEKMFRTRSTPRVRPSRLVPRHPEQNHGRGRRGDQGDGRPGRLTEAHEDWRGIPGGDPMVPDDRPGLCTGAGPASTSARTTSWSSTSRREVPGEKSLQLRGGVQHLRKAVPRGSHPLSRRSRFLGLHQGTGRPAVREALKACNR